MRRHNKEDCKREYSVAIKKNLRTKEIYVETVKNNVRERERGKRDT